MRHLVCKELAIKLAKNYKMKADYEAELAEALGFRPPDRTAPPVVEEEEPEIEVDEGLEGRNLFVFIGFMVLAVTIIGLLLRNFLRKD